ncbi:MAG: helix-turn-helix domain-containing protein, partial [Actinomycetes bacterium]
HLVRKDFGPTIASSIARQLVMPPHRDGGHAQYVSPLGIVDELDEDPIVRTMAWALENLDKQFTVASLARRANMAERTYLRRFSRAVGVSPIQWLTEQRIYASLPILEKSRLSIEKVAASVGIYKAATYRHHFQKVMLTSPSAYRRGLDRPDDQGVRNW